MKPSAPRAEIRCGYRFEPRRITRADAEAILDKLRQRILEINDDPQYLYVVCKVAVFGSYASGNADLGDIDLAVELKARPPLTNEEVVAQSIERAESSGRARNFVAKLAFFLSLRSLQNSILLLMDMQPLLCAFKTSQN